jgi:hypothetical protein
MSNRPRRFFTHAVVTLACLVATTALARAAGSSDEPPSQSAVVSSSASPKGRPASLTPLYVSFGVLQVLDVHSTLRATSSGARETNPLVAGMLSSPAVLVAGKAGVAAGMFLVSEHMRKRHPRAAVLTMLGLNSAYAIVVAHNYAVSARARGGR